MYYLMKEIVCEQTWLIMMSPPQQKPPSSVEAPPRLPVVVLVIPVYATPSSKETWRMMTLALNNNQHFKEKENFEEIKQNYN